jgi:biopolymer transport protein ExbD
MAYAPSRSKKHSTFRKEELNLTSMMDAMTIILLFLLKTFSTQGTIVSPSQDLKLPYSLSVEPPEKELTVAVTQQNILVSDQKVVSIGDINPNEVMIRPLYTELKRRSEEAKQNEILYAIPFKHEILIQGDQEIPFQLLFKVLYTCGQSEYNKLRLLTIREK